MEAEHFQDSYQCLVPPLLQNWTLTLNKLSFLYWKNKLFLNTKQKHYYLWEIPKLWPLLIFSRYWRKHCNRSSSLASLNPSKRLDWLRYHVEILGIPNGESKHLSSVHREFKTNLIGDRVSRLSKQLLFLKKTYTSLPLNRGITRVVTASDVVHKTTLCF